MISTAHDDILVARLKRDYTDKRPVVMEGAPDAHNVFLKVGSQEFCVAKYASETAEDAEWMREMLAIALATIVSAEART